MASVKSCGERSSAQQGWNDPLESGFDIRNRYHRPVDQLLIELRRIVETRLQSHLGPLHRKPQAPKSVIGTPVQLSRNSPRRSTPPRKRPPLSSPEAGRNRFASHLGQKFFASAGPRRHPTPHENCGRNPQVPPQFANQGSGPCRQSKRGQDDKAFPYRSRCNRHCSCSDGRAGRQALRKNLHHVVE
jgi:hypothetical protein